MTSIFIYFHLFSVFQSAWAYGERPIHKRLTDLKRIQKPLQRRKILWISFLLFFLFFFLEKNNQFPLAMAADEELELRVGHAMQLPLMVRTERGHGLHLVWDWGCSHLLDPLKHGGYRSRMPVDISQALQDVKLNTRCQKHFLDQAFGQAMGVLGCVKSIGQSSNLRLLNSLLNVLQY